MAFESVTRIGYIFFFRGRQIYTFYLNTDPRSRNNIAPKSRTQLRAAWVFNDGSDAKGFIADTKTAQKTGFVIVLLLYLDSYGRSNSLDWASNRIYIDKKETRIAVIIGLFDDPPYTCPSFPRKCAQLIQSTFASSLVAFVFRAAIAKHHLSCIFRVTRVLKRPSDLTERRPLKSKALSPEFLYILSEGIYCRLYCVVGWTMASYKYIRRVFCGYPAHMEIIGEGDGSYRVGRGRGLSGA
jgi:hypothetical protein